MAGAEGILGTLRILVDADTSKAQRALKSFGGRAQLAGAAIGAGVGVAAIGALKLGDAYKSASDSIRIGTAATGEELASLKRSMNEVAGRVPDDLATVGQALSDLATRTGKTGDDLEALTESVLDLSRMTGGDATASIASITRLYGDWSVAAEDQVATNDLLLRAFQATGMGVDELARQMVEFGAPLRNLGYDLEDGVAMLSKWEKEGVNTTLALGGLKQALGKFAQAGKPAKESTEALFESIKNADDAARAMAIGVTWFGKRAGPDMVAAIREGRFEFKDFADELENGTETVQALSDDTRDMGDAWKEFGNKIAVTVGPLTSAFAGISESMGNAIFLLPALGGALGKALGGLWAKAAGTGAVRAAAAAAGAATGAIYAGAAAVVGKLQAAMLTLWAAAGGPRVIAAATAAGAKTGAAFAGAAGAGGIIGSIVAAVAVMSPILIPVGLKLTGDFLEQAVGGAIGKTEDIFGVATQGKQAKELRKVYTDLQDQRIAMAKKVNALYGDESDEAQALRKEYDRLSDDARQALYDYRMYMGDTAGAVIGLGQRLRDLKSDAKATTTAVLDTSKGLWQALGGEDVSVEPPDIAGAIRNEFRLATAEVAAGFGSIKQALQNPPQMISKGDRLGNMAARMKKIMANIRKATEIGDPMAQRYWEKARTKQQQQIDKLKGKTVASTKAVKTAYRNAGIDVGNTWTKTKTKTVSAAKTAADKSIENAQRIPTALNSMDLTNAGTNLMNTWAAGITAGIPTAVAAATEGARQIAEVTDGDSPPPKGPLKDIDKGGRNVMEAWLDGAGGLVGRAEDVGTRLASALSPRPTRTALALSGASGGGGGSMTIQVGTLIADDKGIDTLVRRIEQRTGMRSRKRQRDFAGLRVRD